jgi:hypothetical protein
MEVPRIWRGRKWRYGLRVTVDDDREVINDVPAGVKRLFIDTRLKVRPEIAADAVVAISLPLLLTQE